MYACKKKIILMERNTGITHKIYCKEKFVFLYLKEVVMKHENYE
jgi:hypothetical protein